MENSSVDGAIHGESFLPDKNSSENCLRKLGALSQLMVQMTTRLGPKD